MAVFIAELYNKTNPGHWKYDVTLDYSLFLEGLETSTQGKRLSLYMTECSLLSNGHQKDEVWSASQQEKQYFAHSVSYVGAHS